ncbi:LysE family translocator [Streptomyces sp. NPDC052109]|uniref:LysE family translocator n=1 Tax=Streptomyces sp. NPDC052109 TaxID=3155527 RepID=UPI00342D46B8
MPTHLAAAIGILGLPTVVPGPDTAVVTRRALAAGRADALRTVAGIATGLLLWGALAVAGPTAALAAAPAAHLAVKLFGVAYLVFLGVQALRQSHSAAAGATDAGAHSGARGSWRTGLAGNVVNPKIALSRTTGVD